MTMNAELPMTRTRTVEGFAALERNGPITPWSFEQRDLRSHDITFEVLFCGICHTDLHMVGAWGRNFPLVPGHEVVGRVTEVGAEVESFAVGDIVGVGTIVDSCRTCDPCLRGMETYCQQGPTSAYDGIDRLDSSITRGGYAQSGVCDERFVYHIPTGMDLAGTAPLLCAGITTYSPLRHWNVGPGTTVGIIGIGGLGHIAIKIARALGAHVVAFTTSLGKGDAALALGANEVILSRNDKQMMAQTNRFDFLLDTVSAAHPMTSFMQALKLDGTMCSVGLPDHFDVLPFSLATGRRSLASSGAGGSRETVEMLEFCRNHHIIADVEIIAPSEINAALQRLSNNDVKYRFVIDMQRH